jgi:hypothetical protein
MLFMQRGANKPSMLSVVMLNVILLSVVELLEYEGVNNFLSIASSTFISDYERNDQEIITISFQFFSVSFEGQIS